MKNEINKLLYAIIICISFFFGWIGNIHDPQKVENPIEYLLLKFDYALFFLSLSVGFTVMLIRAWFIRKSKK